REHGPFESFYDFCLRVDLRRVTKKVIEMLIKAGAMDGFGMPRKGLFVAIEQTVDVAVSVQKNSEKGQEDLFSGMDVKNKKPTGVAISMKAEWPQSEKLVLEKEAFGFYFSDHPLSPLQDELK